MKTKVVLDLDNSPYKIIYKGLIFYFSSKLYSEKFINNVDGYIKNENLKINSKYHIQINLQVYLAISYYKKIEKRGFKVYDDIAKKEMKENILFANNILY